MAEYTGEVSNFLSKTFEQLNHSLNGFAQKFSTGIATEIAPLVAGGLTLTFIVIGIMAIRGLLDRPFMEVAWTLTKASIIITIALTSAVYQTYVIDVFLTLPDDIVASVMNTAVKGSNVATGQNAAKAIEGLYDLGSYNAGQYFNEAGLMNLPPILYGSLVLIGTLACVIMGALWLFISKVVLALMLGVGPLFICCLIWNPTQQFFWSWVGQILNTIVTSIFVLAIFAIFASIFQIGLRKLEISTTSEAFMDAATYAFLGILCMGVLVSIPQYVSALTGAAGGAVGTAMGRITGGAISMGVGAAKGAYGAAKNSVHSSIAGFQAGKSYQQARAGGASRLSAANSARHTYNETKDDLKRGYPNYAKMNLNKQPELQAPPPPPPKPSLQGNGTYAGGGAVAKANPTKMQTPNYAGSGSGGKFSPKTS